VVEVVLPTSLQEKMVDLVEEVQMEEVLEQETRRQFLHHKEILEELVEHLEHLDQLVAEVQVHPE
jgi:hypothetical protein